MFFKVSLIIDPLFMHWRIQSNREHSLEIFTDVSMTGRQVPFSEPLRYILRDLQSELLLQYAEPTRRFVRNFYDSSVPLET